MFRFRNCFFKYAGTSSEKYNLRMCYVKNQSYDFLSGGDYKLQTGVIPLSVEQKYYGKDYSETPLEFEVEIMNYDNEIPYEQMIELRNWLFGQDGYKRLELKNGWNGYHLNCVLIPKGDITEGNHYKGIRCTVRNASPFWYGEQQEVILGHTSLIANISIDNDLTKNWSVVQLNIPQNNAVDCVIQPEVVFDISRTSSIGFEDRYWFYLTNVKASSFNEAKAKSNGNFLIDNNSSIGFDSTYLDDDGQLEAADTVSIDCQYGIITSQKYPNKTIYPLLIYGGKAKDFLRLHYGINYCRVYNPNAINSITIKYTPLYRMGAF